MMMKWWGWWGWCSSDGDVEDVVVDDDDDDDSDSDDDVDDAINGDYFVDDCGHDDVGVMMITFMELPTMLMMMIKVKVIVYWCTFV